MAGKRYYWLKLQVGFFQELIIKQLRTLSEGDSIVLLYLKLLLKAINTEGIIYYQHILPTLDEKIALDTGEKSALVKLTISALCQYHAAVFLDDQSLQLLYLEDMVGSESASASRVRNHRANQKLIKEKEQSALQCNARKIDEIESNPEALKAIISAPDYFLDSYKKARLVGRVIKILVDEYGLVIDKKYNKFAEVYYNEIIKYRNALGHAMRSNEHADREVFIGEIDKTPLIFTEDLFRQMRASLNEYQQVINLVENSFNQI